MKKYCTLLLIVMGSLHLHAQELYVFSEPASNMPAHSINVKMTAHFPAKQNIYSNSPQRYMPEVMVGVSKKMMMHVYSTFANMHTSNFRFESIGLYAKYRFVSIDEVHKHFRMAVFADGSYTRSPFHYDEISLMGDKSGIEAGLIATQLVNKLAISGTISHTQVLDKSRNNDVIYVPERNYRSINYSLSGGYLLFPRNYTGFKQTNMNLYAEFLAQQTLDRKTNFIDFAPSVQFIFNSISKLNLGYRFQVSGNMERMSKNNFLVSYEYSFLNVWGKKR
jgi:hypothetical protein